MLLRTVILLHCLLFVGPVQQVSQSQLQATPEATPTTPPQKPTQSLHQYTADKHPMRQETVESMDQVILLVATTATMRIHSVTALKGGHPKNIQV